VPRTMLFVVHSATPMGTSVFKVHGVVGMTLLFWVRAVKSVLSAGVAVAGIVWLTCQSWQQHADMLWKRHAHRWPCCVSHWRLDGGLRLTAGMVMAG